MSRHATSSLPREAGKVPEGRMGSRRGLCNQDRASVTKTTSGAPPPLRGTSPTSLGRKAMTLVLLGLIRFYQLVPAYFFRGSCRYEPSCSRYASEAVAVHGPARGSWLAVRRICRCHPWGGLGY